MPNVRYRIEQSFRLVASLCCRRRRPAKQVKPEGTVATRKGASSAGRFQSTAARPRPVEWVPPKLRALSW